MMPRSNWWEWNIQKCLSYIFSSLWLQKSGALKKSPAGFRCQRLKRPQYPSVSFSSLLFSTYPPINLSSSFKAIITAPPEGGVCANSTKNESMNNEDGYFRVLFLFFNPASSLAFFLGLLSASSNQLDYWTPKQILIIIRLRMTSKSVKRIYVRS